MSTLTAQPLVSIVTPVLNRVSTIRACLFSVASQTYPSIEHIVVDGGSSDGTLELLQAFETDRPWRWFSERDDGMYDAINKGLRSARGEIVCYLNSDDLYFPWSVDTAVKRIRRGADLVYGDLAVLERDPDPTGFYIQFYPDFDLGYYTHTATIGQPTAFWRRSLTEEIGYFDTSYRLIGDCEYWLRAGAAGARIEHIAEVLAVQIEHPTTLRATQGDRLRAEFVRLRSRYATVAGPPRWTRWQRLKRSLVWRRHQLELRAAIRRERPDRWPRFASFIQRRQIHVDDTALLAFMLPERFRPTRSAWGSPVELERKLMEEIGVGAYE